MRKILKNTLLLATSGTGIYYLLPKMAKQDIKGVFISVINSTRAAIILYKSFNEYQNQLQPFVYNSPEYHQKRHQIHQRVAKRILQLSKKNRGIYLKLGQYLGNLQRVVPWEFTQILKVLQDSAPPLPFQQMKIVLQSDIKLPIQEIFKQIDPNPIASASLAQVHKGILKDGTLVAIKMQYPFLKTQSKWDLWVLKKITQFCNEMLNKNKNTDYDFIKLYREWTSTLVQQLDFLIQKSNAEKSSQFFKNNDNIYIPKYYNQYCSQRVLVMQFMQGIKLTQKQKLIKQGIDLKLIRQNLIRIFNQMIFKNKFVHCDAHPGNILIRKKQNTIGHQIILLDHGLYRSISQSTVKSISNLYIALATQDKSQVIKNAELLNIHKHFQYLPLIFFYRSKGSRKKIGAPITDEQRKQMRQKDLSNFYSINHILQDLPPQLMYIIRTSNLIASHNKILQGNDRTRYFMLINDSLKILTNSKTSYWYNYFKIISKIWLFQNFYTIFKLIFGVLDS